jgi:N-acetylglucosaminyl-diphospho-decaprenol L-rhamnosyltransferase
LTLSPEHATPNNERRSASPVEEITVILVSWNDAEDLRACVESLARARNRMPGSGPRVSLVVVENGGGGAEILSLWPGASVLVNENNRGFGPAANQGADAAPGDVLLFLNPDTRAEGDPFTAISHGFDTQPEAAALAPQLLDVEDSVAPQITNHKSQITNRRLLSPPDREDQFTFQLRRLPSLASDARELLLVDALAPNSRARRRRRYADCDRNGPFEVEQAAAAALAIRKSAFGRLRGFDARFVPAWFEDVDLCARLPLTGRLLYWPEAQFRHRGGVSSASLGYARFLPVYYRNALRYRRLHYGRAARLFYRPLLAAGMLLRLFAVPFRPTVPRPRGEAARAYLATLALALGLGSRHSQLTNHKSEIQDD